MDARQEGREAAQRLLHTDSLSKESVDMIADAVMDAFAPGYAHGLAEKIRRAYSGDEPDHSWVNNPFDAADLIDPDKEGS